MYLPPSTWYLAPVMKPASSLSKKETIAAMSWGRPTRPTGMSAAMAALRSSVRVPPMMSVSMGAGSDRADGDAVLPELSCPTPGQPQDCGLRGRVPDLGERPAAVEGRDGGGVHDASDPAGDHPPGRGLHHEKRTGGVDGHHLVPLVDLQVEQAHWAGDPGQVHLPTTGGSTSSKCANAAATDSAELMSVTAPSARAPWASSSKVISSTPAALTSTGRGASPPPPGGVPRPGRSRAGHPPRHDGSAVLLEGRDVNAHRRLLDVPRRKRVVGWWM